MLKAGFFVWVLLTVLPAILRKGDDGALIHGEGGRERDRRKEKKDCAGRTVGFGDSA